MTIHPQAQAKTHRARRRLAVLGALIGVVALAGCGSSSNTTSSASTPEAPAATTPSTSSSGPSSTGSASALSLAASPSGALEYNTKSLTAKAGKVTIAFTNASPLEHNVSVETSGGQTVGSTPTFKGGSKTLSLNLKPGIYKFFCSVPGHRQAGMEGTLTVN